MMHPNTRVHFISDEVGNGVVATQAIPKGTITWAQDPLDRVFTEIDALALPKESRELLDYFAFRNADGHHVLCWDHGRYVNHSFRSNCLSTAFGFEIAVRDIAEGEQLTDDYGYLNLDVPWRPLDEGTKRKWVRPDDPLRCSKRWDRQITMALRKAIKVEQPLKGWLPAGLLEALLHGDSLSMPSTRSLFFQGTTLSGNGAPSMS